MQNFLNTWYGSFLKVVISFLLGHVLIQLQQGMTIMEILHKENLNTYLTIAATSGIPIVINLLNPKDTRYGRKPKPEDFPPQTKSIKSE